jgi:hypothetical protein
MSPIFVNDRDHTVRGLAPGATEQADGARADELGAFLPETDKAVVREVPGAGPSLAERQAVERELHEAMRKARRLGISPMSDRLVGDPRTGAVEVTGPEAASVNTPSVGLTTAAVLPEAEQRVVPAGPEPGLPPEGGPYDPRVNPGFNQGPSDGPGVLSDQVTAPPTEAPEGLHPDAYSEAAINGDDGPTAKELKAEIDRRNERIALVNQQLPEDEQLDNLGKSGSRKDLAGRLRQNDEDLADAIKAIESQPSTDKTAEDEAGGAVTTSDVPTR